MYIMYIAAFREKSLFLLSFNFLFHPQQKKIEGSLPEVIKCNKGQESNIYRFFKPFIISLLSHCKMDIDAKFNNLFNKILKILAQDLVKMIFYSKTSKKTCIQCLIYK